MPDNMLDDILLYKFRSMVAMATREKTEQIRLKIIQSTDDLLYEKGFNLMSFTDIAEKAGVPRGNIYYYFRTKDEILEEVIGFRISNMKQMLMGWNQTIKSPLDRLKRYANIPVREKNRVIRYGCPMGTLSSELGKSQVKLKSFAKQQLDCFKDWLNEQFEALGSEQDAKTLSQQMLIRTQGLSVLAHTYGDPGIITSEVRSIEQWLDSIKICKPPP